MVMLGQRYTTPIVTVVCPVTKLHIVQLYNINDDCDDYNDGHLIGIRKTVVPLQ